MIFSSLEYLLFLPIVVLLYWATRGRTRLALTVVASYIFYMSWLPVYGVLLFLMTTVNWLLGLGIDYARTNQQKLMTKSLLIAGLLGNLGCLCYFKYANFFLSNIFAGLNGILQVAGPASSQHALAWSSMHVILPLGISFFVFEFVHYIADVYKGAPPVRSWLEFAAFAAFFPSQIAGPIKRYQEFMSSLRNPTPLNRGLCAEGGTLIMQGLFKKVAIADPISLIIAPLFAPHLVLSAPDALLASAGFVIQVYCDFSGYTDMGRGSALLLGIRLPINFALPFLANNLLEFWRCWHMSLSVWLRDYVYIPMGGSRTSLLGNWRNLFVTMVACGLWHGAAWHYVLFGCVQGVGLVVNREWRTYMRSKNNVSAVIGDTWLGYALGNVLTLAFVISTYTMFRAPDIPTSLSILGSWFSGQQICTAWQPILKSGVIALLAVYMGFWVITELLKRRYKLTDLSLPVYPMPLRLASWTAAVFLIVAARPTVATPFVYFQF